MSDFTDTVVTRAPAARGGDERVMRGGPPIEDSMELDRHSRGGGILESYSDGKTDRVLPDSVRERIEKLEAEANAGEVEPDENKGEQPGEKPAEVAADAKPAEAVPGKPAETAIADPAAIAEHKARAEQLEAANQKLLVELEAARATPKDAPSPNKLLAEASDIYLTDSIGAHRRLIAAALGIADPTSKEVDAELAALYTDLTANELGVTPDPNHEAKRESARTRQLLERDKRERKAEEEASASKAKADAEAKQADAVSEFIGNRLQTKRDDGRSIADDHPLLATLSETFDGLAPHKLLAKVLQQETKTGRIVLSGDDAKDIAAAAKLIENHYQVLVDKIAKAKPTTPSNPSTATTPNGTQPSAAKPSASKDTRQTTAARTLTTADASVAPATPPAQQAATKDKRPKFKSKKEEQDWALRLLDKK